MELLSCILCHKIKLFWLGQDHILVTPRKMNPRVIFCFSSSLFSLCCLFFPPGSFFSPRARHFPLLLVFAWDEWEINIVCADIHKLTECETHAGDGWQHCCVCVCVCSFMMFVEQTLSSDHDHALTHPGRRRSEVRRRSQAKMAPTGV